MAKVIIHPNDSDGVAVYYPAPECTIPLYERGRKDVPAGRPFLIIEEDLLPSDHTFFDAFEADFSNPDGYGIGCDAWFAEQV
jgi:hypothetical protein